MTVEVLPQLFSVCKLAPGTPLACNAPFTFAARTDAELSLVCLSAAAPGETLAREDGWRAFRVAGQLAFSLTGVLHAITGALAGRGVPLFAVSTFDTDYVLVKEERLSDALEALRDAGLRCVPHGDSGLEKEVDKGGENR